MPKLPVKKAERIMTEEIIANTKIGAVINIAKIFRENICTHSNGQMNNRECQILEFIVGAFLAKSDILVGDCKDLKHLGSPYTMQKAVKKLVEMGFVNYRKSNDSRKRFIIPTEQALCLFSSIYERITKDAGYQQG